jgi:tRNA(fMet)-specific endonuclease VapC
MRYLLDTNICIYIIKKSPSRVLEKLTSMQVGDAGISTITLSELEYGVAKSSKPQQNRDALIAFLTPFEILSYDQSAATHYGAIRSYLEKKGILIGSMDLLIAAHALSLSLTMVTNNVREFKRVPDLRLENWS